MKRTFLLLTVAILISSAFISCSKNKDSEVTYKVKYKVTGSAGVKISSLVYATDGTGGMNTITDMNKQTFESEELTFAKKGYATMSLNARGPDASSTIKAQIFINGELAKESTATGTILVTSVSAAD